MPQTLEEVSRAVFSLNPQELESLYDQIGERLFASHSEIDEMDDEKLEAELNRRHEEMTSDPSMRIPQAVFMAELWKIANEGN